MTARALECARECQVMSQVVEDTEAVRAVEQFLGERGDTAGPWGGCGGAAGRALTLGVSPMSPMSPLSPCSAPRR